MAAQAADRRVRWSAELPRGRTQLQGWRSALHLDLHHKAFQEYHAKYKGGPLRDGVAGYFMPTTSWIFLFDDEGTAEKRIFEINKQVHEGVHQLEYWFTRQRNKWRAPFVGQNAISEGIAEYLGAVEMDIHRKLRFVHLNPTRLNGMQQYAAQIKPRGREYPIFPIEKLVSFESYREATDWVTAERELPGAGVMLLYQQSWAFTYFLHEHEGGKYKEKWVTFFDSVLDRQTGSGMAASVFARIFGLRDEDDWEALNDEWADFVHEDLMKRDASSTIYAPPGRNEWPDDGEDD